jgi:Domain of unknown function (DUF4232)
MNPIEERLTALLHSVTPQPPRAVSVDEIGSRVRKGRTMVDVFSMRTRGVRWYAPALTATVAAVILIAGGLGVAVLRSSGSGTPGGPPASPSSTATSPVPTSPSPLASAPASPGVHSSPAQQPVGSCQTRHLAASSVGTGGGGQAPTLIIVLTNRGGSACTLIGYPGISIRGHTASGSASAPLSVTVRDGSVFARTDPGPHQLVLRPGGAASFALETHSAYDVQYLITMFLITVPGDAGTVALPVTMGAAAPPGQPIPVGVTALVAGNTGPSQ